MRPRSYIFPVRTKKGHDSYTLSPNIITKRFIHVWFHSPRYEQEDRIIDEN